MPNRTAMRSWPGLVSVVLLALLVGGPAAPAGASGRWASLDPEGGTVLALALDPTTPTTLYAGTDFGGTSVFHQGPMPTPVLRLAQNLAHTGATHTLNVALAPGTTPMAAGLYLALQAPDGSLSFLREGVGLTPPGCRSRRTGPGRCRIGWS